MFTHWCFWLEMRLFFDWDWDGWSCWETCTTQWTWETLLKFIKNDAVAKRTLFWTIFLTSPWSVASQFLVKWANFFLGSSTGHLLSRMSTSKHKVRHTHGNDMGIRLGRSLVVLIQLVHGCFKRRLKDTVLWLLRCLLPGTVHFFNRRKGIVESWSVRGRSMSSLHGIVLQSPYLDLILSHTPISFPILVYLCLILS